MLRKFNDFSVEITHLLEKINLVAEHKTSEGIVYQHWILPFFEPTNPQASDEEKQG